VGKRPLLRNVLAKSLGTRPCRFGRNVPDTASTQIIPAQLLADNSGYGARWPSKVRSGHCPPRQRLLAVVIQRMTCTKYGSWATTGQSPEQVGGFTSDTDYRNPADLRLLSPVKAPWHALSTISQARPTIGLAEYATAMGSVKLTVCAVRRRGSSGGERPSPVACRSRPL